MRTDGWTDRHVGANSRSSQFCERASKTANVIEGVIIRHLRKRVYYGMRSKTKVNSVLYSAHKYLKLFKEKSIVQNVGTSNKIVKNL